VTANPSVLRVFIIEDNEDVAVSTSLLLKFLGHGSETVSRGEAALEKALAYRPDLLLIDLALPEVDGYELANQFRSNCAFDDTPMFAFSGYADAVHRQRAMDAGFDGFMSKPFTIADLESVCRRAQTVIAETNVRVQRALAAAHATREISRRCRAALDEFWLNRCASD